MREYKTITKIEGPLIFLEKTHKIGFEELVEIELENGELKRGQVLDTSKDAVIVQVFEETRGISKKNIVRFKGESIKLGVSKEMVGRIFSGFGSPIDDGPEIISEKKIDVNGAAINPWSRDSPKDFIQTGLSTIDTMNTLVKGQKLPIFSGAGLPHNEIALQIASQAKTNRKFSVVFGAMGITNDEASRFIEKFEQTGALERSVVYLNLANDPSIERLITPRMALTTAEYLAYEHGQDVLVILTDMTNYCESLREIAAAREEVPGRRGFPGYMYTDLSSIYERAGMIKGIEGSITQLPILTMPNDDITHPIPDLTGYITEGQVVLSRNLYRNDIYPPIDVLPSLSRLMNAGIGKGKTHEAHKEISNQLYAAYAEGRDLRGLVSIVGEEALNERDKKFLQFAKAFENKFTRQGINENRNLEKSIKIGWELLKILPRNELSRLENKTIEKYLEKGEKK